MMTTQRAQKEIDERISELEKIKSGLINQAVEYGRRIDHLRELKEKFKLQIQLIK